MMKQLIRKLRSKKGESLVESMAAILIFTMASIVLYSMVVSAGDINRTAKEKDQQIQTQLVSVEKGDPDARTGSGVVTMTLVAQNGSTIKIAEVDVEIYGGQGDSLFAYFVELPGGD